MLVLGGHGSGATVDDWRSGVRVNVDAWGSGVSVGAWRSGVRGER